ncbi:MAG: hypothetical protein IJQ39_00475 [Thermoguttaceae bacterium]|nr:hypothetical protein [Thermoguttaceae bacterium]
MSTNNNNLFTDFETLGQSEAYSAEDFLSSEPLSEHSDAITPQFQGLIPEPTDALFDKMWESCDSLDNTVNASVATSQRGRTKFQPLSPDAFMSPISVLEGRGSAPAFDDVYPERLRPIQKSSVQPVQKAVPDEIAYFERLWETGEFPNHESNRTQNVLVSEELGAQSEVLDRSQQSTRRAQPSVQPSSTSVEIPQLLETQTVVSRKNIAESGVVNEELTNCQPSAQMQSSTRNSQPTPAVQPAAQNTQPAPAPQSAAQNSLPAPATQPAAQNSKSCSGWTLSLISCLTALFIGLFIFGWNMLPAYLVQSQIQQATGLSLRIKNVSQDYRAGVTTVESVQAFDSAQRPFFETGRAVFSSLPYFVGDNQQMKWATVEDIRFAPTPNVVNTMNVSLSDNEFNKTLKSVSKELDDSQIDLLVKNSVSTISSPYEQSIRQAQQEVKDITKQIQVLQERLLSSGEEASDADKAQAASYEQRMQMALRAMSIEESQFNQRNAALLGALHSKSKNCCAEAIIPALEDGEVTQYLFAQDYTEFIGKLLYEIRQFCRWLPADLEKALGPVDKLDPASLSFRRIITQEQLSVGQLRLTGQTQFMNQTVPFSAVISNYSTLPNGKPLTLDVAFGENQSARLHLEAYRSEQRTEIKVEFASSNVNPGEQFGMEDGLRVKLQPDEKTPFVQTRSIQFIVADGKIQGEYAMAQTAPSISIELKGVSSEDNAAKLEELVESLEKITLNGTISGPFSKPDLRVSSNLESWGRTVLTIAANEYDMRMDKYRAVIEQKSVEAVESEQERIAKIAQDVKVSANGNALLLNQLSSGVVDSQIVVGQTPSDALQEKNSEEPMLEVKEEDLDAQQVADSSDELSLPSLDELKTDENAQTEIPFPELPVPEAETVQPSAQVAAGDVVLDDLPPKDESEAALPIETDSNLTETAPLLVAPGENSVQNEQVEEDSDILLPNVEELAPIVPEENVETTADSTSQPVYALPSLEELAPKSGSQMTAPTELPMISDSAVEINSSDANYESPEMEFLDDKPMEEALPEDDAVQIGDAIPLVAPNTTPHRTTPPALPIVIED